MKKFYFTLIILISCFCGTIFATPSFFSLADTQSLNFQLVNADNNIHYANLTNIRQLAVNTDGYYYNCSTSTINYYTTSTRLNKELDYAFNNIQDIFCYNDYLLVVDKDTDNKNELLIFDSLNQITHLKNNVTLPNFNKFDFYSTNNKLYIGLITSENNYFYLYTFDENLNQIVNPYVFNDNTKYSNIAFITINDSKAYIIGGATTGVVNNIYCLTYLSNEVVSIAFRPSGISSVKFFKYNGNDYLLTNNADINVSNLISDNGNDNEGKIEYTLTHENILSWTAFTKGKINSPTDIYIYNNNFYVADSGNKDIQQFSLTSSTEISIICNSVCLASSGGDIGRLNGVNNILVKDDNQIIISDSLNNRIQIWDDNNSSINDFCNASNTSPNPKAVLQDENQNIYIIADTNTGVNSELRIYNSTYNLTKTINTISGGTSVGRISSACMDKNNLVVAINYSTNKIITYSLSSSLEYFRQIDSPILDTFNQNTKISYIEKSNSYILYNDDTFYLLNASFERVSSLVVASVIDYTTDFNNTIYAIKNSSLLTFDINNNNITNTTTLTDSKFQNITEIGINKASRKLYFYNNNLCCIYSFNDYIEKVDCNNPCSVETSSYTNSLTNCGIINNCYIYDLPYQLGESYQILANTNIIVLGTFEDDSNYTYVLYNNNSTLKSGYIKTSLILSRTMDSQSLNFITTNKSVKIFKYPTILKYNNSLITCGTLPINTKLTSIGKYPLNIDGKDFYVFNNNGRYFYIFNADLVINNNTEITNLLVHNAKVNILDGNNTIKVYEEENAQSTVLNTLTNEYKIYVEQYDRNTNLTKIKYMIDEIEYSGYIETKYVSLNSVTPLQYTSIILLSVAVVLLGVLITIYICTNKKKHKF